MGRKRRPTEPPSYQPAPEVPSELAERFELVTHVLAKTMTMSEGARRAGISRANFQTLVHRVQQGMLDALAPRPSGRQPTPEREAALAKEVERLQRKNAAQEEELAMVGRLLGAAGEMLRGQRRPRTAKPSSTPSSPSSAGSSTEGEDGEDPDPDPAATVLLARAATMREWGVSAAWRAAVLGVSRATLARWQARAGRGEQLRLRERVTVPCEEAVARVRELVRETHGLPGAAAIAHAVDGVSRRQAARIKADERTAMERERRASCGRVQVPVPGVVRGFDAMHVPTTGGVRYCLIAADAAVPYRTSIGQVPRYDAGAVAEHLAADIEVHGAPLVYRMDRAACHDAPPVVSVLAAAGVLVLHGPPHHPRYYGQLERQNREHRAWLEAVGPLSPDELEDECARMRLGLNAHWPRAKLAWRTPESVWRQRPTVSVDRTALREEVTGRAARLCGRGVPEPLSQRLAIEKALRDRGFLRLQPEEQVLRD